ncbi:MAG: NitT/TauT family transport system substrate-binding protein, partial [Alphaproteobacteria bacterium]|nr:NitT/TauT family transport system substrate-binding protein [Alphaproteobacteria bacterium]
MAARRPMWHSPGMMTLREEPVRILSAVLLTIVLASAAGAQQRAPVKITVVPSIPAASTFLALDKGYFRDAGLDVTIERVDSLSRAVPFLATNQVQVGQGGISAGFFNAVAEGLPLTITLDAGSTPL